MKLVAGLGNPGPRYDGTRHNVGFVVVEELLRRWNCGAGKYERRFEAEVAEANAAGQRVLLIRPQTFMNLSGRSVAAVMRFYKVPLTDLLVVCDDLDLPVGALRIRASGSGGGQKGLENILLHLSSNDVARVRLGIGKVHKSVTSDYVLSRFDPREREVMQETVASAADAVECWLRHEVNTAMNKFNRKAEPKTAGENRRGCTKASEGESS